MKRIYIALAVLAVALASVFVWQVFKPSDEPVYKGRTLSSWLKPDVEDDFHDLKAGEAVYHIGTNAIPSLLRMLRVKDSPFKVKFVSLVQKQRIIVIDNLTDAEYWNWAAARGFHVLGAKAQSAVPALLEIANQNISRTSQSYAIEALGFIGPPAKEAVPFLIRCATATNTDVNVLYFPIEALSRIDPAAAAKAGVK
jgi:hypothetical protein